MKARLFVSYSSIFQLEVEGVKADYDVFVHDFQALLNRWHQKFDLEYPSQEDTRLFGNYCRDVQGQGRSLAYAG